ASTNDRSSGTSTARPTRSSSRRAKTSSRTTTTTTVHPTRPKMTKNTVTIAARRAGSSESTRDVTIGARVGGIREDLVGGVVLDEATFAVIVFVDLGRHERGHVGHASRLLHVVCDDHDRVV